MSKIFKDTEGREWVVAINVAIVKRLKQSLEVDLLDNLGIQLLEQIATNPIRLADVLFVICEKQAADRGLDDVAFGSALAGDTLEDAAVALMQSIADFFPSGRRQVIQAALAKMKDVERRTIDKGVAMMESNLIDQAMEKHFQRSTEEAEKLLASGESFGT